MDREFPTAATERNEINIENFLERVSKIAKSRIRYRYGAEVRSLMSDDTPWVSIGFLLAAAGMKVKMKTGFPLGL